MTTLSARCQAVSAIVADVETARKNQHVRERVEQRTQEWNEQRGRLSVVTKQAEWLALHYRQQPEFAQRHELLSRNAKEAVERLAAGEDVTALTEDPLWSKLLASAE